MSKTFQNDMKTTNYSYTERKIVANPLGIVLAVMLICLFLLYLSINILQLISYDYNRRKFFLTYYNIENVKYMVEPMIIWSIFTTIAYCLIQMYIPVRALCQPSFAAGKPSPHKFWPFLAIATVLITFAHTARHIYSAFPSDLFVNLFVSAILIFSTFIIYTRDDDKVPKGSFNLKPWVLIPMFEESV